MSPTARRYPLSALVELSGLSENALAHKVGLSGSTLKKAREDGLLEPAADRYAVRAGFHPYEVWPEMLDHALEDTSIECAGGCGTPIQPTRADHRFCSRRCKERVGQRRRYHTDELTRRRRIESAAAYYAEAGDYVRTRERLRRREAS